MGFESSRTALAFCLRESFGIPLFVIKTYFVVRGTMSESSGQCSRLIQTTVGVLMLLTWQFSQFLFLAELLAVAALFALNLGLGELNYFEHFAFKILHYLIPSKLRNRNFWTWDLSIWSAYSRNGLTNLPNYLFMRCQFIIQFSISKIGCYKQLSRAVAKAHYLRYSDPFILQSMALSLSLGFQILRIPQIQNYENLIKAPLGVATGVLFKILFSILGTELIRVFLSWFQKH